MKSLEKIISSTKRILRTSLLAGTLVVSPFLSGCEKKEDNQNKNVQNTSTIEGNPTQERIRGYFPLAVGNEWTYKCIISSDHKPLFSFLAEVEKPHWSRGHKKGDWIWNYGRCLNAKSGIEKYKITGYEKSRGAFKVEPSEGAIDDRKYSLQELVDLYWLYNQDGVWEVARARDLGETILVNGFIAFFKPGITSEEMTERKQKITCEYSKKTIQVPAGNFTNCLKNRTTLVGIDEEEIKTISYFAINVGLVKEVQYNSKGEIKY